MSNTINDDGYWPFRAISWGRIRFFCGNCEDVTLADRSDVVGSTYDCTHCETTSAGTDRPSVGRIASRCTHPSPLPNGNAEVREGYARPTHDFSNHQ